MRVVALTFHDVIENGRAPALDESDRFYRISTAAFESLLSQLRRLGYQTVSSRHFRAWQQGRKTLPERTVVLTFDDGCASHFETVAPLLLRYKFSGTFFIAPELIGKPGYMHWEQLRKLIFLGMEVGSHGMSHQPLTDLSKLQLEQELRGSRQVLEAQLGVPIRALSAPRGFWNRTVADAVQQAGYEAAWVSTVGTNGAETNALALRRVVVRGAFSVERLVSMVEGWRPAFWWAASHQRAIRLLKSVLGVYGYEQLKRRLVPNA